MVNLFNIVVSEEKIHPNFKWMLTDYHAPARRIITQWTDGFIDRDNKIVKEFQTSFNSSFWEFYIYAVLKSLKFEIDFSFDSPDFCVSKDNMKFILEATIASHAKGASPEWVKGKLEELTPQDIFTIENISIIRLANAIRGKHQMYIDRYSSLEHVRGLPYIICIAPFEQPSFYIQADSSIRKLLYKFSAPLYGKDEKGNVRILGKEYIDNVVKFNNAIIELGLFTDDRMKEVSAIIFSSTATITKLKALACGEYPNTIFSATRYQQGAWDVPYYIVKNGENYHESLCDGLHIFINPFADIPFDVDVFFHEDIALHVYDIETKTSRTYLRDGHLISHSSMNISEKLPIGIQKTIDNDTEWTPVATKQQDGILYPLNATVGCGVNNHITRYNGWTIIVFMDDIDHNWGGIAKKIVVYKIQDFINAKDAEFVITKIDSQDKDTAFAEVKILIDQSTQLEKKLNSL